MGEGLARPSGQKRKLEKQEEQLKNYNKDLTMVGCETLARVLGMGGYSQLSRLVC